MKKTLLAVAIWSGMALGWATVSVAEMAPAEMKDFSVICYRNDAAFLVEAPEGWRNDALTARRLGICAMLVPAGFTFDDAPVVLYPNLLDAPKGDSLAEQADIQAARVLMETRRKPGGQNAVVTSLENFRSPQGLEFAVRLFENGPPPNVTEIAAYAVHGDIMFFLVLSAQHSEHVFDNMGSLEEALSKVHAMPVTRERRDESRKGRMSGTRSDIVSGQEWGG